MGTLAARRARLNVIRACCAPAWQEIASQRCVNKKNEGKSELVHRKLRTWQEWESGNSAIDMACWELFVTKAVRGKA